MKEDSKGIYISGVKGVGTAVPQANELVIGSFHPPLDEESFWVYVPVDSPGLKVFCREVVHRPDSSPYDHPLTSRGEEIESIVAFDNLFVPNERIIAKSNRELHGVNFYNVWARLEHWYTFVRIVAKAELYAGLAQLIVDTLELGEVAVVRERVAHIIEYCQILQGMQLAAEELAAPSEGGVMTPDVNVVTAGRSYALDNLPQMLHILQDICGQGLVLRWSEADLETSAAFGKNLSWFLDTREMSARDKNLVMNLVWDVSASEHATRSKLFEESNALNVAVPQAASLRGVRPQHVPRRLPPLHRSRAGAGAHVRGADRRSLALERRPRHARAEGPVGSGRVPRSPLLTSLVGSYPQPDWLIDRAKLAGRFPPRVRAHELWRVAQERLLEAQDDATLLAIRDQEAAGLDIVTDGEARRESYSNRFATALEGVDVDNPGTALDRSGHPNPVPRIVGPVKRRGPVMVRDVEFLKANTDRLVKITVPGPFTMSQQAQNDAYESEEQLALDYAAAVREEIIDLHNAGADIVQVDEPYMQARPEKAREHGLVALNAALEGIEKPTAVHICFGYAAIIHERPSGYSFLPELEGCHCDPDLDRDGAVLARYVGARAAALEDDHPWRHRPEHRRDRDGGDGRRSHSAGSPLQGARVHRRRA